MTRPDTARVPAVLVNATMVWALLATTVPYLAFLGIEISRTRELFTVYLLVGMAVVGTWWKHTSSRVAWVIATLGAASVIGLITWTGAYNWLQGINYWSEWLLASAMLMFGVAFARTNWRVWSTIVIAYGTLLAVVQLGSLMVGLSSPGGLNGEPGFYGYRPLAASVALFLVLGFALTIFTDGPFARVRPWVATLLGVSVILSQNRSAWVALLIVLAGCVLALLRREALRDRWPGVAAPAVFFAVVLLVPLVSGSSVLPGSDGQTDRALPESATSVTTSQWRLEMWRSRLEADRSPVEWLTGGVFGPTPVKGPGSQVMNPYISGHNVVVDVLTMLGLFGVGLVLLLWLWGSFLRPDRLWALPIFLWGLAGFGMFYNWPAWGWAVLGASLATTGQRLVPTAASSQEGKVVARSE